MSTEEKLRKALEETRHYIANSVDFDPKDREGRMVLRIVEDTLRETAKEEAPNA